MKMFVNIHTHTHILPYIYALIRRKAKEHRKGERRQTKRAKKRDVCKQIA